MIKKEITANGATVEEAIENGCAELGVERENVKFEIIDMPKSKTLGLFGGAPAVVRVYQESNRAEDAADYLRSIIDAMELEGVEIEIVMNEDETGAALNLRGDALGAIIGRRGETLAALQYLVSLAANNGDDEYFRIAINIGNYREKRESSLENLANKTAARSLKIGKNLALDPMNPYERRIVHTAVQKVDGASSWSVGEGAKRHVVIGPEGVAEGEEGLPVNHSRNNTRPGGKPGYGSRSGGSSYGNRGGGYKKSYGNRSGGSSYGNRGGYSRDNRDGGSSYGNRSSSYGNRGGYIKDGGYNKDTGYNRDGGYNKEGSGNRSGGYQKSYNRDGNSSYNRSNSSRSYNNTNTQSNVSREAKKDTSAPLYGRIEVPKKKTENTEE